MRQRIEGLQAKPEMNGRTGVVRGAFNAQSDRWTVEVAADEVGPAYVGSFRPANYFSRSHRVECEPSDASSSGARLFRSRTLIRMCRTGA